MLLANGQLRSMICGGDVTDLGDYKFEVLRKCGEPQIQEVIGYRVNRRGDREMILEQWVYGPRRGLYYILQFEGGRLKKIETRINR
jgi:hypothetical protein